MNIRYLAGGIFAALAFGTVSQAQGIGSIVVPEQSVTTAMIGFVSGQTARLNVLSLDTVIVPLTGSSSSTTTGCTVQLAFYDNKGALISQTTVNNLATGAATFFDLPRGSVASEPSTTSTTRAEIRGVVTVNPTSTTSTTPSGYCTVLPSLEIYDSTGSTVAITTTTSAIRVAAATTTSGGAN